MPSKRSQDLYIFYYDINETQTGLNFLHSLLSENEKEEACKRQLATVKNTYISSKGLLRFILKEKFKLRSIEIKKNDYGKPYLENTPLHFNVSHSKNKIIFAFTKKSPVGIDIEYITPKKNNDQISKKYFSKEEQDYINTHPTPQRAFYTIWTKKEAFIKAQGKGLFTALNSFSIINSPLGFKVKENEMLNPLYQGYELHIHPDYESCVMVKGSESIRFHVEELVF